MTKILATTDTSPLGQQGVKHAQALADALGAQLTVLSILSDPTPAVAGEFAYVPPLTPEEIMAQEEELQSSLNKAFPDLKVVTRHSGGRPVWQAILDEARSTGANMIVMTTHGRTGLGRVLLGSVAEAVVQHSPVPVMLVRGEQTVANWK